MAKKKIISFDLDGTLIDQRFVDAIWFDGVPKLFAAKKEIPLELALESVKKEYDKIGMQKLEWYNIRFWLRRFGLKDDWKLLLNSYRSKVRLYPEVPRVLRELKSKNFDLIIITNSPKEFHNIELEEVRIRNFFKRIFSSTSEFKQVKNTTDFYFKIVSILKVSPQQIVHVGDNWHFDYIIPRKIGIKSFYLDREKQKKGKSIVRNLNEFITKLELS